MVEGAVESALSPDFKGLCLGMRGGAWISSDRRRHCKSSSRFGAQRLPADRLAATSRAYMSDSRYSPYSDLRMSSARAATWAVSIQPL